MTTSNSQLHNSQCLGVGRFGRWELPSGFTLVELMIAICVAAILMAMAAFALVRARASANEAGAIANLRSINQGQLAYNAACGRSFYAPSLPVLAMPPNAASTGGYIDDEIGSAAVVEDAGYRLQIQLGKDGFVSTYPDCNGNMPISAYYATAVPVAPGDTGIRAFATNQIGGLWQRTDSIAPTEPFGPPAEIAK